jgi:hypothetical protein
MSARLSGNRGTSRQERNPAGFAGLLETPRQADLAE